MSEEDMVADMAMMKAGISSLERQLAAALAEADRMRAVCRRGDDLFTAYAVIVRDMGFPVVAADFNAYAAEFRDAHDAAGLTTDVGRPAPGDSGESSRHA
jgi:hypothetical protein